MSSENSERNVRRTLQGVVTSTSMQKTITVEVERTFQHAKYGKFVRRKKKYMVHDEKDEGQIGDLVEVAATRPMSKRKRWRLVRVVEKAKVAEDVKNAEETVASLMEGGDA